MKGRFAALDRTGPLRLEGAHDVLSNSSVRGQGGMELLRSSVRRGSVMVVDARFPPGEYKPPSYGHLLTVRRSGPLRRFWRLDGRTLEATAGVNDVGVVPLGRTVAFEMQETTEALSVVLRDGFVSQIAERAGVDYARVEVLGSLYLPDPPLARLLRSFLPELGGGGLGGELYTEALANQLAVHLLRRHSSLGRRRRLEVVRPPAGPVPKRAISRALDYIGDNLSGALSLAELAQTAGYSPNHFAKLFGEATGLPPHRYVLGERVKRARKLLESTELSLAEVARMSGFSSQSHMGRAVKAATGTTPGRLRREGRR